MKKGLLIVLLTAVITASGFAETAKNSFSLDLGPTIQWVIAGGFGLGADYEFNFIIPELSLTLEFEYGSSATAASGYAVAYPFIQSVFSLTPGLNLRYYPFSKAVSGFWFGIGYNFNLLMAILQPLGSTPNWRLIGTFHIFPIDIGYKWIVAGDSGFFLEPYIGYAFNTTTMATINVPGTVNGGLKLGFAF